MKFSTILFAFTIVLLTFSCELLLVTPEDRLEKETNYNQGGKAWMTIDSIESHTCLSIPWSNVNASHSYPMDILSLNLMFSFSCKNDNQPNRRVYLDLYDFEGEQEYELGGGDEGSKGAISFSGVGVSEQYYTTEDYTGKVVITDYSMNEDEIYSVSGTYEFEGLDDSLNVISVNNGVFTRIKIE